MKLYGPSRLLKAAFFCPHFCLCRIVCTIRLVQSELVRIERLAHAIRRLPISAASTHASGKLTDG